MCFEKEQVKTIYTMEGALRELPVAISQICVNYIFDLLLVRIKRKSEGSRMEPKYNNAGKHRK